jgi:hypothetical protein
VGATPCVRIVVAPFGTQKTEGRRAKGERSVKIIENLKQFYTNLAYHEQIAVFTFVAIDRLIITLMLPITQKM